MVLVTWPRWPACPYMVKIFFSGTKSRWPFNLECSIGCSSITKFIQRISLGWTWPILWQGQIWSFMLLCGKKVKQWIFQKLLSSMIWNYIATDDRSDKNFLLTSKLCPLGAVCPCPGAIYMYKIMKKKYIIRFQRFFLNLQQMTVVTRCSCWYQNFVPRGLSAPAQGLKSWKKKMYKIRLQRDFFCNQ